MSSQNSSVSRRKPLTKRGEETVSKVLDACRQLLEEKGYGKLTTNHVAQQAGVSIGTLYQYFPNKESLLYALIERWYQALNQEFERSLEDQLQQGDIFTAIRYVYTNILDLQYQHYRAYEDVDKVAAYIPELAELKARHTEQFAQRLLGLFASFGYDTKGPRLAQLSVFLYQMAVVMLNLTAAQVGSARESYLQLSLRVMDEMVRAVIELGVNQSQ